MAVHSGLKLAQALRLSPSLGRLRPKIRVQRLGFSVPLGCLGFGFRV